MLGRLFKFFVLAFVLLAVYRWLFSREQRRSFREWAVTLAQALVISSGLIAALYVFGLR